MHELLMAMVTNSSMGFTVIMIMVIGGPAVIILAMYLQRPSPKYHIEKMDAQAKEHERKMYELGTERVVKTQVQRLTAHDQTKVIDNRVSDSERLPVEDTYR